MRTARSLGGIARRVRASAARTHGPVVEAGIAVGALLAYNLAKARTGGDLETGLANARRIIALERRLGIFIEPAVQRRVMRSRLAERAWGAAYLMSQLVVLPATLRTVYRRQPDLYPTLRTMAILAWGSGVAWYACQPVAPPRLVPGIGIADSVTNGVIPMDHPIVRLLYHPVAAMPSLHVGMSPVVTWALWSATDTPVLRAAALAYPLAVATTVVVTGNHFLADIAGGVAVVIPAALIARWISRGSDTSPGRNAGAGANTNAPAGA